MQAEGITSPWKGVISTLHLTLNLLAPAKPFAVLPFPNISAQDIGMKAKAIRGLSGNAPDKL